VRLGVVGIGFGQHAHVPALRNDPRAVVSAICASSYERAAAVAERLAIPRAHSDWAALVGDPDIDAVTISVPPVLQPAIAIAAAAAGKHVFCEKPVACDASQAAAMLDAARAAGVVHAVDFEFRAVPAWQRAKTLCDDGVLGGIRHAVVSWQVETLAYRRPTESWKRRRCDGGGTLNLFVSHSLDYIEWLLGPITRLAARFAGPEASGGSRDTAQAEAQVDAWFELASGAPVTLSVAANAPFGSGHRLEIYGDAGTLVLENRTADHANGFGLHIATRASGGMARVAVDGEAPAGDGRIAAVSRLVRDFLDAIDGSGGALRPDLEDGLRVQMLIDRMRRADVEGTWQS